MQLRAHVPALHVALPFAEGHAEHELPHDAGSLSARHCWPHRWKPGLQVSPHWPPPHVATPFVDGHGVHEPPHELDEESETH